MDKFIEGPYVVGENVAYRYNIYTANEYPYEYKGIPIKIRKVVECVWNTDDRDKKQMKSTADLFARSPDMNKLLEDILSYYDNKKQLTGEETLFQHRIRRLLN